MKQIELRYFLAPFLIVWSWVEFIEKAAGSAFEWLLFLWKLRHEK